MSRMFMEQFTKSEKNFFCAAPFFRGVPPDVVYGLFDIGDAVHFPKDARVSCIGETVDPVFFVMSGLLRVSACAESGRRITFLLVKRAEPYNLLGPYLETGRILEAEAARPTRCLRISGRRFRTFVADHPVIGPNIMRWIGIGLDSANSRILDLMEKKVENRILRVLSTLHEKFGTPLFFTSQEISEIAGTTPESTLRTMGQLREMGIITTQRGQMVNTNEIENYTGTGRINGAELSMKMYERTQELGVPFDYITITGITANGLFKVLTCEEDDTEIRARAGITRSLTSVTLFDLTADPKLCEQLRAQPNVTIYPFQEVLEFTGQNSLNGVRFRSTDKDGRECHVPCDGVFEYIGLSFLCDDFIRYIRACLSDQV